MSNRVLFRLAFLLMLASCLSCSTERKLAKKFLNEHKGESLMLSPVDFIYKENPAAYIDTRKYTTPEQQDSVAFYSSKFVQHVSDSIFLTLFMNSLIETLESYSFNVFMDQEANLFLASPKPGWILQMAQMSLVEDYSISSVSGYDYEGEEFIHQFRVNEVSLDTWLEVNRVNTVQSKQLLFLSGYIRDDTSRRISLDYDFGQFYYTNDNDSIDLDNIYEMADASGRKHAELLFDYFMNDYIQRNMQGVLPKMSFHYNSIWNRLENHPWEYFELIK
ncbi:MAG: hypothetical protein IPH88_10145 [Bacteroidales bacterium]|nr:hypothetical protein [Bacteroidales bacterium]